MLLLLGIATLGTTPAYAANKVKGKISGDNPSQYQVVVVGRDTRSTIASVGASGKFSVNTKNGGTLHLVNKSGRYFGPIVASKGARAYASLSGKAGSLGRVSVKNGFATVPYGKSANIFRKSAALPFDRTTGPRGAGKFGLVAVPASAKAPDRSSADRMRPAALTAGTDSDRDGLPDVLDIDDDGDLILDISDDDTSATTADYGAETFSTLRLDLADSLNVNAGTFDTTQLETLVRENLFLLFGVRNNVAGSTITSANIDCLSLPYCVAGTGTAEVAEFNRQAVLPHQSPWISYDPDGDGLPNIYVEDGTASFGTNINVKPKASLSELRPGDTVYFKLQTSEGKYTIPAVLPFFFSTTPALASWSSGAQSGTITYPVSAGSPGTTVGNPLVLGSTSVTFTYWKPQRQAIQGAEEDGYIDIGRLKYGVYLSPSDSTNPPITCQRGDVSIPSSTLEVTTLNDEVNTIKLVQDTALDATADPAATLSFTLAIGDCLARNAESISGRVVSIDLTATAESQDQSSQSFYVQLPD